MDRQGEAAAVTDPAAAMRNSGPAIARIGDHDTSQITVGVGDSYRHLPDRHAGTWVSASCPEFWRDRRSRAWRQAAARSDIHYREGQDGYPYPYLAWSAGQSLHTCRTQQAFVWFLTVVAAQLFVLRRLAGHRRTTGVALAAAAWAASWAMVIVAGHLGGGGGAEVAFAAAMVIFALGETLLSPTLPAIINDLAPPRAAGRYNGLGALAFTTGFLLGSASGAAALGAGQGTGLFAVMILACAAAAIAALRLNRHLPPAANQIPAAPAPSTAAASRQPHRSRPAHASNPRSPDKNRAATTAPSPPDPAGNPPVPTGRHPAALRPGSTARLAPIIPAAFRRGPEAGIPSPPSHRPSSACPAARRAVQEARNQIRRTTFQPDGRRPARTRSRSGPAGYGQRTPR